MKVFLSQSPFLVMDNPGVFLTIGPCDRGTFFFIKSINHGSPYETDRFLILFMGFDNSNKNMEYDQPFPLKRLISYLFY